MCIKRQQPCGKYVGVWFVCFLRCVFVYVVKYLYIKKKNQGRILNIVLKFTIFIYFLISYHHYAKV